MKGIIGIVTPVYATEGNGRVPLLNETLYSVQSQSYPNYVHLVIDDGSTIDVKGAIMPWLRTDSRIRYLRRERNPNDLKTASNALNFGIDRFLDGQVLIHREAEELQGITYLHSDDLLARGGLEQRVTALSDGVAFSHSKSANFYKGRVVFITNINGNVPLHNYPSRIYHGVFADHTIMWQIEFLRRLKVFVEENYGQKGVFDPNLWFMEDRDAAISSMEAALAYRKEMIYIPVIAVFYRMHGQSISGNGFNKDVHNQTNLIKEKHKMPKNQLPYLLQGSFNHFPTTLVRSLPPSKFKTLIMHLGLEIFARLPPRYRILEQEISEIVKGEILELVAHYSRS